MPIQTIILEDEAKSLNVISNLIRQFTSDIELIGSAGWVDKSVQLISEKTPQLVFMDIRLADGTGFDVLRRVASRDFELIFVTAYEEYALDALRASAVDYLLKPIGIPEFEGAVGRVRDKIREKKNLEHTSVERKIGVATLSGYEFIDAKDIIWCTSRSGYTHFHCSDGKKLISSRNLGFYEDLLYPRNFYRIHNSSIINLRFLKSYIKGKISYVVLTDGTRLEISQRRKGEFLEMLFPEK
jgi:two-component system LytT family response regulator